MFTIVNEIRGTLDSQWVGFFHSTLVVDPTGLFSDTERVGTCFGQSNDIRSPGNRYS